MINGYPKYIDYSDVNLTPSIHCHDFPVLKREDGKRYYPSDPALEDCFNSAQNKTLFEVACFCSFLNDTIAVEHDVVIPSISALKRINYQIPNEAYESMCRFIADEGHHAVQALHFKSELESSFELPSAGYGEVPMFIRMLNKVRNRISSAALRDEYLVLCGVVTETRISRELGEFSRDISINTSVREVCRIHQSDEAIHASQFKALGKWLWQQYDIDKKRWAAEMYSSAVICRNIIDRDQIALNLSIAESIGYQAAIEIVYTHITDKDMHKRMLGSCRSTLKYLKSLGVTTFSEFYRPLEKAGISWEEYC